MDENNIENFDSRYEKELKMQRELEKVEITAVKLKEKYNEYKELASFIDYLKGTEKLFIMARARSWGGEQLKEELVKIDINLFSINSGLDENIFSAIRDDFQSVYSDISDIHSVSKKLLEKHKNCKDCQEFIAYLRDISIIFYNSKKGNESFEEIREKVFTSRMKIISANKNTDLKMLEKIYEEFKKELKM